MQVVGRFEENGRAVGNRPSTRDVFGVHGVGGIVGAPLTGVFATTVNPAGFDGLLHHASALSSAPKAQQRA